MSNQSQAAERLTARLRIARSDGAFFGGFICIAVYSLARLLDVLANGSSVGWLPWPVRLGLLIVFVLVMVTGRRNSTRRLKAWVDSEYEEEDSLTKEHRRKTAEMSADNSLGKAVYGSYYAKQVESFIADGRGAPEDSDYDRFHGESVTVAGQTIRALERLREANE